MRNLPYTASPATSTNPYFKHVNRAPYELGYLLRQLPRGLDPFFKLSPEAIQIAEAAAQHASNSSDTLLHGLEALGHFMYVAGDNDENEVERGALASLGVLIQHMAVEMEFLQETECNLRYALREYQAQDNKEGK